jgi:hypothetical protein
VRRSWRQALREVALIFVGITLALLFENWNQERQARVQEHELLAQILSDLRATQHDLTRGDLLNGIPRGDLPSLEAAHESHRRIMEELNRTGVVEQEVWAQDFAVLMRGGSRLYPQTAGYQSLKTIGVDLISDDSLRVAVTRFFELTMGRVAQGEDTLWEAQDDFLAPYVFAHFRGRVPVDSAGLGAVVPLDPSLLRGDPSFPLVMDRIDLDRARALNQYRTAERELDSLIRRLEELVGVDGAL